MRTSAQLAKYGRFTVCPARYHAGSVGIGVRLVTARATPKLVLGLAILFGCVPAFSALPAGVARVNRDQRDTCKGGLVLQKQQQLGKRPGMQNSTLLAPGLDPSANTRKVFELQSASGAFSFGNDLLGNIVVHPGCKAALLTGEQLQPALGSAGLLLLELGAQPAMPMANRLEFGPGVSLSIGVAGDVRNAEIHTEKVCRHNRRAGWKIDRAIQVELPLAVDQIGLALDAVKPLLLVFAVHQRSNHAALWQRPQTHFIEALESEDTLVVGDSPVWFEDRTFGLIAGEALDSFTDGAYRHLGRQPEAGANLRVCQLVDRRLAEDLRIEPFTRRERSRFIGAFHRCQQPFGLLGVRQKLQLERQLHYLGVYHSATGKEQSVLRTEILFLCRLKAAVSKDQIL